MKGAPEVVIHSCRYIQLEDRTDIQIEGACHMRYLDHHVKGLASNEPTCGLKPILFAYKDMKLEDFDQLAGENLNFETEESRLILETDLILLALFGLEDPIRPEVPAEL